MDNVQGYNMRLYQVYKISIAGQKDDYYLLGMRQSDGGIRAF